MLRLLRLLASIMGLAVAGCATSSDCADYLPSSIAAMRQASGSGCFEIEHAVVLARTPSTSAPRLYVEDAKGGDFSAIMAKCSPTSGHACPLEAADDLLHVLEGAQVTLRGYYHQSSVSGFEELYLDEVLDEGILVSRPPPSPVTADDLARDRREPAKWFQIVSTTIPDDDPWVMYDFTPPELAGSHACPSVHGFALIPKSLGTTKAAGCNGTENPPARSVADPREILVGRQFFSTFWASTDCACAVDAKQHLLTPYSTLKGPIEGILILEVPRGSAAGYQLFEPLSKALFPITGG